MIATINDRIETVNADQMLECVDESLEHAGNMASCMHASEHVVATAISAAMVAGFNLRGVVDMLPGGATDVENLRNFRGLAGEIANKHAGRFARRLMVAGDFEDYMPN